MSSRREVLIRILALLQRKTLIETKNRTLKWHYWTVRSIKNVALLTEDGAFALFFRPHPGGFASSRVPTPGNLPSKAKKMLIPGGQPGGGLGAGGIDRCIKMNCNSLYNRRFMSPARRTRYFAQRARRARITKRGKKKKISQKYFFLLPSSRASRKMPRLPRLANKAKAACMA